MDQLYFEEGFIEASYFVYTAEARIDFAPYIDSEYIDVLYFDERGSWATLVGELTQVFGSVVEANGSWSSEFTQTSTATKIIEFSVTITDAFTPTVTAAVTKNQVSIMTSETTLSADGVANRSAQITLENIITLSAQSVKTADITSDLTATVEISAAALVVQLATATISSTTALTASGFILNKRPRIYTVSGAGIDTSIKKWGTGSAKFDSSSDETTVPDSIDWHTKTWRSVDFWVYVTSPGNASNGLFTVLRHGTGLNSWILDLSVQNNTTPKRISGIRYQVTATSVVGVANTSQLNLALDTWHHIRFTDDGSAYRFWINGTRISTYNLGYTYDSSSRDFSGALTIGDDASYNTFYIDELLITKDVLTASSTSSFTPPTDRWYPEDQSQILLLSHYDTDFSDDLGIAKLATATLSANASLAATAITVKSAQATITATATQTTQAVKVTAATSTLSATTAVTATAFRQKPGLAAITAATAVAIDAVKTTDVNSDLSSAAGVDSTAYRIKQFSIAITDAFTPTVDADAQLAGVALLESQSQLSIDANYQAAAASAVTATATVTATVTQTIGIVADLTAESAMTTDNVRVRYADTALSVVATQSAAETYLRLASAAITSTATVETTATKFRQFSADIASAFTQSTEAAKTTDVISSQTSEFAQTAQGDRSRSTDVTISSAFTQDTQAVKTPGFLIALNSESTQTTLAVKTADVIPLLDSIATQLTVAVKNATGTITLESQFTQQTQPFRIVEYKGNDNLGVSAYNTKTPRVGPLSDMGTFGFAVNTVGFTASLWFRRRTVGNVYQPLWSPSTPGQSTYETGLVIDNDNIRLRSTTDADEPGATWQNIAPTDTNWHQVILLCSRTNNGDPNGLGVYWKLWLDGVYRGERSYFAVQGLNAFRNNGYLDLAAGPPNTIYDEIYPTGQRNLELDFAQIWVGQLSSKIDNIFNRRISDLEAGLFYDNGYIDLGVTGQGSHGLLPVPKIYNTLDQPWTGVVLTGYSSDEKPARLALDTPDLQAVFAVTATPQQRVVSTGSLTVSATMVTAISATRSADSEITATMTLQAEADTRIGVIAGLSSDTALTALVGVIKPLSSTLSTETTVFCLPGFVEEFTADLNTLAEIQASVDVRPPVRAEASLLATTTVIADVSSFTDNIVLLASSGELTVDATLIPPIRAEADLQSEFTVTAVIGAIEQFAVLTAASGTLTASAARTRNLAADLASTSAVDGSVTRIRGYSAEISALYATVTVGDVINIDPFLTLIIEPESRLLTVNQESRVLTPKQETRTLIVEGWE